MANVKAYTKKDGTRVKAHRRGKSVVKAYVRTLSLEKRLKKRDERQGRKGMLHDRKMLWGVQAKKHKKLDKLMSTRAGQRAVQRIHKKLK